MPKSVIERAPATTPEAVLAAIDALAPTVAARAADVEAARRLPPDLLRELVDAGCFRLLLPASHGGAGADLAQATRATEALARADGSVGWTTMIGSTAWCDLVHLPRATFDDVFADPDTIIAGVINPGGSIEPAGDGYRVTGRWAFATGVEHATWIGANCIAGMGPDGPRMRFAVLSPGDVAIEDTWRVGGLRGTGSHHFAVDGAIVPGDRTFDPLGDGAPCIDDPLARIPAPTLVALRVAAVALGIAAGALDDIGALAADKVPLLAAGTLATSPTYHHDLAAADGDLRAARGLLAEAVGATWDTAVAGDPFTLPARARVRIDAAWTTERAASVVRRAYRAGGGTALYDECPLQRRLRDIEALGQHFLVRPDVLAAAGSVLAGLDPPGPLF
jgi:alkylation response protein AidB-like acyl-CoA dehydrogenase